MRWTEKLDDGRIVIRLPISNDKTAKGWDSWVEPSVTDGKDTELYQKYDILLAGEAAEKLYKFEEMEAIGIHADIPKGAWPCDPRKNTTCSKRGCFTKGGPCSLTTNKEYALEEEQP